MRLSLPPDVSSFQNYMGFSLPPDRKFVQSDWGVCMDVVVEAKGHNTCFVCVFFYALASNRCFPLRWPCRLVSDFDVEGRV